MLVGNSGVAEHIGEGLGFLRKEALDEVESLVVVAEMYASAELQEEPLLLGLVVGLWWWGAGEPTQLKVGVVESEGLYFGVSALVLEDLGQAAAEGQAEKVGEAGDSEGFPE